MANKRTEIAYYAGQEDVTRKHGAIIAIKDNQNLRDSEKIKWGKKMGPPMFHIVGIDGVYISDLPKEMLDFGGRVSRIHLDEKKMSLEEKTQLAREDRYGISPSLDKHTVTIERIASVSTDTANQVIDSEK